MTPFSSSPPRSRIVLGIFLLVLTIQTGQGTKTPPHSYIHPNAHPHPHLHHYQQHDPANQQVLVVTSHHHQDGNYPQQPHQIPVHSSSPQLYISPEFSPPTDTQHYYNVPTNFANNPPTVHDNFADNPPPTVTTPQPTTTSTTTAQPSSSSSPGSNRTPHHLPFFERKIHKIANKFSRFFNHLFHGHSHNNYNDGARAWYPSNNNNNYYNQQQQYYRPNYYPRYPPFNQQYQTARQRTDFDHYGSCKFRPCRSVGHAIDSFFIRDGFGKLLQKFHH